MFVNSYTEYFRNVFRILHNICKILLLQQRKIMKLPAKYYKIVASNIKELDCIYKILLNILENFFCNCPGK